MNLLKQQNEFIADKVFHGINKFQSRLLLRKKKKILFSLKPAWEDVIRKSFRFLQHEIVFNDLSPDIIQEYDLVVPLNISDIKYINEFRNLLDDNPLPIPTLESILLCDDKYQFNKALIENDFGQLVPAVDDVRSYPYILKKRNDEWGRNSHIISNRQQERSFSNILDDPEYFIQQLIAGPYEYATHILFKRHKIVCSLTIEYGFRTQTPIKGKDQPIYIKTSFCPYLHLFTSILTSIGFNGLCCINYKVSDNRPFIFEINPRFGNSLCPFFYTFVRHIF